MTKTVHGVIHGNTIELTENPGVPDGEHVEITITRGAGRADRRGAGLLRCAGALSAEWTDEDDRILDDIYQERKRDQGRDTGE